MKSTNANRSPHLYQNQPTEEFIERHLPSLATLALGFTKHGDNTKLTDRSHFGPLRVQKPFYPEGPGVCHTIVVHPPGGIVGGDEIKIDANVNPHARALITTPGAAKWYRANGRTSLQNVTLKIAPGGSLEWLPQETIFFDAASVRMRHDVEMAADGTYIGSEILCFGRAASGEAFGTGRVEQRTTIRCGQRLIWFEQGAIIAGLPIMQNDIGLNSGTVCATFIAVGAGMSLALVDAIRAGAGVGMPAKCGSSFGVTLMKKVLVARYVGQSSEMAGLLMRSTWALVRPVLTGLEATIPRVWNT